MNSAVLLLSGGLDSVVSLALLKNEYRDIIALTFNYGQKSFIAEKESSEKIAKYYNLKHEIVHLDWLSNISTSALNNDNDVPMLTMSDLNSIDVTLNSSKSVWVPNRNGLFVNIAACYAEALGHDSIIIGANKEEAATFKDNSIDFINAVNFSLKNSTNSLIEIVAPLVQLSKTEIIKKAIELKVPFEFIHSCYSSNEKHCGKCESCLRLLRALEENSALDIIKMIFDR